MKLSLILPPISFDEQLEAFNVIAGIASSMQLPGIVTSDEDQELPDIILVPNDAQLAEFFSYNIQTNMINYTPTAKDDSSILQFVGYNLFQIKLIISQGEEYAYDLSVQIQVCSLSVP